MSRAELQEVRTQGVCTCDTQGHLPCAECPRSSGGPAPLHLGGGYQLHVGFPHPPSSVLATTTCHSPFSSPGLQGFGAMGAQAECWPRTAVSPSADGSSRIPTWLLEGLGGYTL